MSKTVTFLSSETYKKCINCYKIKLNYRLKLKLLDLYYCYKRDKTMADTLFYIPNDFTQNYPFRRLKRLNTHLNETAIIINLSPISFLANK